MCGNCRLWMVPPTDLWKLDLWDAGVHCDGIYSHTQGKRSLTLDVPSSAALSVVTVPGLEPPVPRATLQGHVRSFSKSSGDSA